MMRSLCALALCLCFVAQAWAQAPKTMVRTSVEGKAPFVAGQQVRLNVDALTTTWFTQAPVYPQISAPNAVINLLDERAQNFNESIGGEKWFGVSRSYLVTPTGDGDIVIAPFEITLYPGQGKDPVKLKTREVRLQVKVVARPAGTEGMLASTGVQISQKLDKKLEDLKVGDAFTRSIEVRAAGAQGMFIPPTTFPAIKGLAVYPKPGTVDNIMQDRAGFVGSRRVDAATYVIQEEGRYELPEVIVDWWNTSSGKAEKARVPALQFKAAPNPDYKPTFGLPQEAAAPVRHVINWHFVGLLAGFGLLALLVLYALARYLPRILARLRAWRSARQQRYTASEPAAYKRVVQALNNNDANKTYAALLAWAAHPDQPMRSRGLDALSRSSSALAAQIDALRFALYGESGVTWQASILLQAITQLRGMQLKTQQSGTALQPLNP